MPKIPPKRGRVNSYFLTKDVNYGDVSLKEGEMVFVQEGSVSDTHSTLVGQNVKAQVPVDEFDGQNSPFQRIENPLHEAARRGDLELLSFCLEHNMSVNGLDKSGSTPLYWAAFNGHAEAVKKLLTHEKVEVSAQNKLGETALHVAVARFHGNCVEPLVESGADLYVRNREGKQPLDLSPNVDIAAFLIVAMQKTPPTDAQGFKDSSDEEASG